MQIAGFLAAARHIVANDQASTQKNLRVQFGFLQPIGADRAHNRSFS